MKPLVHAVLKANPKTSDQMYLCVLCNCVFVYLFDCVFLCLCICGTMTLLGNPVHAVLKASPDDHQ